MITVDSNVFVSALRFGGRPMELLRRVNLTGPEIAISEALVQEIVKVFREKFGYSTDELAELRKRIAGFTVSIMPNQVVHVITEDPDDDRVLECALSSGSHTIVTGDKDLLRRGEFSGIRIMRVSEYLDELKARIH